MAEISSGNDDKSVEKTSSFKIFGLGPSTPSRSLSKKKSNPFSKMFSRKKSENKQSVDDDDDNLSNNTDGDNGRAEEIDVSTVATQPIIETIGQELKIANSVLEPKESIPVTDDEENKTDLVSRLKGAAENPTEKMVEKGKEMFKQFTAQGEKASEKMFEKGKEGLTETLKPFTALEKTSETILEKGKEEVVNEEKTSEEIMEKGKKGLQELVNKALATNNYEKSSSSVDEQPPPPVPVPAPAPVAMNDQKKNTSVNIGEEKNTTGDGKTGDQPSNLDPKPQEANEATVIQSADRSEDTQNQQNHKSEDNCVASLAEGLQKICATWNNNNNNNNNKDV